jgi:zinc finger-like protein
MEHFTFDEQAALVWQFMCSIPVNLMEKFLPWLASCLSREEREEMVACMHKIVPRQELLQQVNAISFWGISYMFPHICRGTERISKEKNSF